VARAAGLSLGEIAQRFSSVVPPRGRLELLQKDPFSIILDFAHTPDALQRVLETLKPLYPGRLIVVFGAGGAARAIVAALIEVGVPDGPRDDEMVLILAMATSGRVHARLAGGFTLADRGQPGVPA
jgi:UDP-N-acetylmuramyl tripeptide synthase